MEISVIIPLYNKALYIQRAIDSIMNQTSSVSEIIVIDDGSSDNGYEIVQELALQNQKIKLFKQENRGVSFTRNRGVQLAKSAFIAFFDADDEWKPDYISLIHRLYNNFPDCGAYATSYLVLSENGKQPPPRFNEIPPAPWIGIVPNLFKAMQTSALFYTSSIVILKTVFEDMGGFPEGVKRGEDLVLWIRLGMNYPIAYSPFRQVIYHTEAGNRACKIFPSLEEPAHTKEIEDLLKKGRVPVGLVNDVSEYYYLENIRKAKELIDYGDIKTARYLLDKARNTKNHKREYYLWRFWAGRIPALFLPLARKAKRCVNK